MLDAKTLARRREGIGYVFAQLLLRDDDHGLAGDGGCVSGHDHLFDAVAVQPDTPVSEPKDIVGTQGGADVAEEAMDQTRKPN